ncbi:hypothetical protein M9H77_36701 [Catharanthus roseus]|uniref:Uncharacterized protein n=1 Tax=Catharanthus roseus TaxID=4058 RepID=A0ACB9ZV44_CATRO|nr:hypothetical protein M9H77_36701 [Catharanthus roseus]
MESPPSSSPRNGESERRFRRILTSKLLAQSITGKSCSICLCRIEERRAAVVIPCNHAYCVECIRKWSNFKRNCPLCNSQFDSWFFRINLSSQTFHKEKLRAAPAKGASVSLSDVHSPRGRRLAEQLRLTRRCREEFGASSSRTRPLPWRRSFSRGQDEHPDVIAKRIIRWRASVYEQQLRAIPISSKNCLLQQITTSNNAKKLVLQRIEPWIKRELHAVLGDPDPPVIVHVATSLFISMHERKHECIPEQLDVAHGFLSPLWRFLHERTEMFWHELRCFAECSYSMETYDGLVEYARLVD